MISPFDRNFANCHGVRFLTPALLSVVLLAGTSRAAPAAALFEPYGSSLAGATSGPPPLTLPSLRQPHPDGVIPPPAGNPWATSQPPRLHSNFRLHAEWRWTEKPGNGGVLVHISSGPKDRAWPLCYQIQLKNKAAGDLLPMAGATFTGTAHAAPRAPATPLKAHTAADGEKPAGEWNSCDITCRNDTIEVTINGVAQENRVTGCSR